MALFTTTPCEIHAVSTRIRQLKPLVLQPLELQPRKQLATPVFPQPLRVHLSVKIKAVTTGGQSESFESPKPELRWEGKSRSGERGNKGLFSYNPERSGLMCPCCIRRRTVSDQDHQTLLAAEKSGPTDTPKNSLAASLLQKRLTRPRWIDELYAWGLTKMTNYYESSAGVFKRDLFEIQLKEASEKGAEILGRPFEIVELGIGTGPNLKFYAGPNIHVTGIDPSTAAGKYAEGAAKEAGLARDQFRYVEAVGEGIPLPDNSADAVISSLVLCSVADLELTLAEVHRVLRPGGQYFFLEHVAGPEGSPVRWWQNLLDPLQQIVFDGCHLTREPIPVLKDVGFTLDAQNETLETFIFFLAPHLVGKGTKLAEVQ